VLAIPFNPCYNTGMNNTIRITQQGGVQYTFENGYTLSIGCGPMHYSSNRDDDAFAECTEVEVAIRNPAGGWVALEMDVAGYVPAGNIPSLMRAVEDKDWEHCALLCGQDEYDYTKNRRDEDPTSTQSQPSGYYTEEDAYA
jgi:hypothetical protein